MKICSLYGAGFYYIPGTDTCLKVGGFVRIDAIYGNTAGPNESINFNSVHDRTTRNFFTRARAYATLDARSQTEYGTLRSYFLTGATVDNAATTPYMNRAYIQLAGWTWGLTTSIFDGYTTTPFHLNNVASTNGSIGATGIWQWAYTAQLGNGLSASIAIEDPNRRDSGVFLVAGAGPVARTKGAQFPDLVGNLRVNQSWGYAMIAAALHDASATYRVVNTTAPGDALGWAVNASTFIKVPGMPGDTFGLTFGYAKGATGYVSANINTAATGIFGNIHGSSVGTGFRSDGVFGATGGIELTTAWNVEAGYEHAWSKSLKTSVAGGYVKIDYNAAATALLQASTFCTGGGLVGTCDPDFAVWNVGSRTTWTPVQNLSLSLDVLYSHIDSANASPVTAGVAAGGTTGDQNNWLTMVRVQRVFWP